MGSLWFFKNFSTNEGFAKTPLTKRANKLRSVEYTVDCEAKGPQFQIDPNRSGTAELVAPGQTLN